MSEQDIINEIFETHLNSTFSKESKQQIANIYSVEIASKVIAIYSDAMNAPVDWKIATIDSALPILHELLDTKYPWLSAKARAKLNYAFIMTWK